MNAQKIKKIHIASEWSKSPTGRYQSDGKSNATDFKKKFILNDLDAVAVFVIDLDGTDGYGSSFLEEAFGGLVRDGLISKADFNQKFTFKSEEDPSFVDEIFSYVNDAS